jgi:hypothetical protein
MGGWVDGWEGSPGPADGSIAGYEMLGIWRGEMSEREWVAILSLRRPRKVLYRTLPMHSMHLLVGRERASERERGHCSCSSSIGRLPEIRRYRDREPSWLARRVREDRSGMGDAESLPSVSTDAPSTVLRSAGSRADADG